MTVSEKLQKAAKLVWECEMEAQDKNDRIERKLGKIQEELTTMSMDVRRSE